MTSYAPIACSDYDVIELVCVESYELEIVLDDETVIGTPLTVETDSAAEYLIVRLSDEATDRIRLDRIRRVVVRSRPARFEAHTFGVPL